MKLTVITNVDGKVVGTSEGHASDPAPKGEDHAKLIPGPGQTFHEINVPDELLPSEKCSGDDISKFHKQLKTYLH